MEHPHILDQVAKDDDDDEQAESVSPSACTRPDSPAETDDSSQPSSAMSSVSQRGKKRKRLVVLTQTKGGDFWSMVDKWFSARMQIDQLGTSWTTPGWARYVCFILILLDLLLKKSYAL